MPCMKVMWDHALGGFCLSQGAHGPAVRIWPRGMHLRPPPIPREHGAFMEMNNDN